MIRSLSADTKDALARELPSARHCREALLAGLELYRAHKGRVRRERYAVARLHRTLRQASAESDRTATSAKPARRCDRVMEARAAFMVCGSLSAGIQGYHLEFVPGEKEYAARLDWVLRAIADPPKRMRRKDHVILYYKDFEAIVMLLTVLGAHATVLTLEDIHALKETKNRIHRLVNSETANLERVATAAAGQRRTIEYLTSAYGLHHLPASLREIAQLRMRYPDESLLEIGRRCTPPISKAAASGRFSALTRLANSLRGAPAR